MQINLLPWREEERRNKKITFLFSIGIAILLAIFLLIILHIIFQQLISYQEQRNKYLQAIIDRENSNIVQINKKKQEIATIVDELNFIISLRDSSYDAVRGLDALANIVPDGVAFTSIARDGKQFEIVGKAKSDLEVTQFMGNIKKSTIFQQPVLTNISSHTTPAGEERQFDIKVEQKRFA